jgi:ADP-ribose pyrophosphatase YjhB (NUDIX family)
MAAEDNVTSLETTGPVREAAVSLIFDTSANVLTVWNKRYNGWTLPGGLVEEGETTAAAQERELREETGLETFSAQCIYDAPAIGQPKDGRGSHVYVFLVRPVRGDPRAAEQGCPVIWMPRETFLKECPFKEFYIEMFTIIGPRLVFSSRGLDRYVTFVEPPPEIPPAAITEPDLPPE